MHEALLPRWITLNPLVAVAYVVSTLTRTSLVNQKNCVLTRFQHVIAAGYTGSLAVGKQSLQ